VVPENRFPAAERYCLQLQESCRISKWQGGQIPDSFTPPGSPPARRPETHDGVVRREKSALPELAQAKQTGSQTLINGTSSGGEVSTRQGPCPSEPYTDMELLMTLH
jgi:hypothetical protein